MFLEETLPAWEQEAIEETYQCIMRLVWCYQTDSPAFTATMRKAVCVLAEQVRLTVQREELEKTMDEQRRQHSMIWKALLERQQQEERDA